MYCSFVRTLENAQFKLNEFRNCDVKINKIFENLFEINFSSELPLKYVKSYYYKFIKNSYGVYNVNNYLIAVKMFNLNVIPKTLEIGNNVFYLNYGFFKADEDMKEKIRNEVINEKINLKHGVSFNVNTNFETVKKMIEKLSTVFNRYYLRLIASSGFISLNNKNKIAYYVDSKDNVFDLIKIIEFKEFTRIKIISMSILRDNVSHYSFYLVSLLNELINRKIYKIKIVNNLTL